jgi:hypothetical protein
MKTDGRFGLYRGLQHTFDGLKNDLKFCVVALFHLFDFSPKVLVSGGSGYAAPFNGPYAWTKDNKRII